MIQQGPTSDQVIAAVCAASGLSRAAITGPCRLRPLVRPRQLAAYLMRQHCGHLSLPAIGSKLGGREHTTIKHAISVASSLLEEDPDFRALHDTAVEMLAHQLSRFDPRGGRALLMAPYEPPPKPKPKPKVFPKPPAKPQSAAKMRGCLSCGDSFVSIWIGERVCGRCKNCEAWKSGDVGQAVSAGRWL